METLIKYFSKTAVIIALWHSSLVAIGQETTTIQKAFEQSYIHEYAGKLPDAISTIKAIYAENSYEINLRLGWLHYSSGLFSESSTFYQKAVTLLPYSIEARLGLVLPHIALGNWDKAIAQYKAILEIDNKNTTVNYRMGLIYYGKEEFETAYKYFETVVNIYPFDYDFVLMFAWTNFKLGKLREATILFNKANLINPNDASVKEGLQLINN